MRVVLVMMKVLIALVFLLSSQVVQAQVICIGAPLKTITYQYRYNGTCCDVQMSYYECLNAAGDLVIEVGTITILDPTCWGFPIGSPPPISANALMQKGIRKAIGANTFQNVPNCPNGTWYGSTYNAPCYKWILVTVTVPPPGYSYQMFQAVPCGEATCVRRCLVCRSTTETDDCNGTEPMINYIGCQYLSNPVEPCDPTPGLTLCNEDMCGS